MLGKLMKGPRNIRYTVNGGATTFKPTISDSEEIVGIYGRY